MKESESRKVDINKETLQKRGCINLAFDLDSSYGTKRRNSHKTIADREIPVSELIKEQPMELNYNGLLGRRKTIPSRIKQRSFRKYSDKSRHYNFMYDEVGNTSHGNYQTVTAYVKREGNIRKLTSTAEAHKMTGQDIFLEQEDKMESSYCVHDVDVVDINLETSEIQEERPSNGSAILNENEISGVARVSGINANEIKLQVSTEIMANVIKVPPRKKYLEMSVPFNKSPTVNMHLMTQNKQNAKHKRITQTLGIIILVFLICWLPFCIAWPINTFCDCIDTRFYDFTYWAAYINSTLNPILYFITNRDFRIALAGIMFKLFPRKSRTVGIRMERNS